MEDFEENDFRRYNPRFTGDNLPRTSNSVDDIRKIASRKNATQAKSRWPGCCRSRTPSFRSRHQEGKYLIENNKAANVTLDKSEVDEIDAIINSFKVSGTRYGARNDGHRRVLVS